MSSGLTEIVRASLVGSVAGNLLLVLGLTLLLGLEGPIDRRSAYLSLGLVGFAAVLLLAAAMPGFHGDENRRSLAELSVLISVVLLAVCAVVTRYALRRHRQIGLAAEPGPGSGDGWPLAAALTVLGVATALTALVSETLVSTLQAFAAAAHLPEFFVALIIVAIVGNATEHGSAIMLARRGRIKLATEIPLASGAQIAGLVHAAHRAALLGLAAADAQLPAVRADCPGGRRGAARAGAAQRPHHPAERRDPAVRLLGAGGDLLPGRRRLGCAPKLGPQLPCAGPSAGPPSSPSSLARSASYRAMAASLMCS